jgi:hypothetical protein
MAVHILPISARMRGGSFIEYNPVKSMGSGILTF